MEAGEGQGAEASLNGDVEGELRFELGDAGKHTDACPVEGPEFEPRLHDTSQQ